MPSSWFGAASEVTCKRKFCNGDAVLDSPDWLDDHLTAKRRCIIMTESDDPGDEVLMHSDFDCQNMNPGQLSTTFGANIHSLSADMNANLGCEEQMSAEDDATKMNNNYTQATNGYPAVQLPCGSVVNSASEDVDSMECDAGSASIAAINAPAISASASPDNGQCVAYSRCYCKIAARADMLCSRAYYVSDYY